MPGKPVSFTEKTIIMVQGKSGMGKSTLCNFLVGDRRDIKRLCTDSFFSISFVENNFKCSSGREFAKYLSNFQSPTDKISQISRRGDFNKDIFCKLIHDQIKRIFKHNSCKMIILEGYTLVLCEHILSDLLGEYRIWNTEPINS